MEFPFLVLLVSGGHSLLVVAHSINRWSIIGQTVDDAPGEALDKVFIYILFVAVVVRTLYLYALGSQYLTTVPSHLSWLIIGGYYE